MSIIRYCIILFILLNHSSKLTAQKVSLSKEEKIEFQQRAERMINLFTETLTIIPSYSTDVDSRILKDKAIRNTLRLFTKEATMQLAYASGKKSAPIPMPRYLSSLTDYESKRELVYIDIIDFTIDKVEPHPTELGSYIVKFEFVQRFRKKKEYTPDSMSNGEKIEQILWDYEDITTKNGSAVIKKVTTQSGTKWIMLLGDVEAKAIEVITN